MAELPRPTLEEICVALADLAERVVTDPGITLDGELRDALRARVADLETHIPGLDSPPDIEEALRFASAAAASLVYEQPRDALALALEGLSWAPHHAELHYLAASSCFDLGATREAVCLLAHALWVNPGHRRARQEIEALSAYRDGVES